jgi:paraquat-inducible protein B
MATMRESIRKIRRMIGTADGILTNNVAVTLDQVNTTLEELRAPIATADSVLKSTDAALLGKDAPLQQDLRNALEEVTKAARSLRILMDYLEQHPESLIRGKTEVKP